MPATSFNPVGFLVNLAIGRFSMSFMQATVRALLSGKRGEVLSRFKSIAFSHDRPAAALNVATIAAIWVVATAIWFAIRQK